MRNLRFFAGTFLSGLYARFGHSFNAVADELARQVAHGELSPDKYNVIMDEFDAWMERRGKRKKRQLKLL